MTDETSIHFAEEESDTIVRGIQALARVSRSVTQRASDITELLVKRKSIFP